LAADESQSQGQYPPRSALGLSSMLPRAKIDRHIKLA
jgi:hypothetical protein